MPKTIKAKLTLMFQKIKIAMLKSKIKKMERISYLSLWDRIELRNTNALLNRLRQN
jgi:hypothetical protein